MIARIQQLKHELGWQGMSGIVLVLLGLFFSNAVLKPQEERAGVMRDKAESLNQRSSLSAGIPGDTPQSKAVVLKRFYDFFVDDKEITDHLAKIYNLAESSGLVLRQGDYKLVLGKNERLMQYQILLPVTGGYNQVRGFVARLLDKVPVISLDQINFERKNANVPTIEAQIMITLYIVRP